MMFSPTLSRRMALPPTGDAPVVGLKSSIIRPATPHKPDVMSSPLKPGPSLLPSSAIFSTALSPTLSVLTCAPGCVVPSISTGAVRSGRGWCVVLPTKMVCTPLPRMLK